MGVKIFRLHFRGLGLISCWIRLFCGIRGMVHPIFIGLYCYPRNVLADAKLETNFMCSPVPFRPERTGTKYVGLSSELQEATRKQSLGTKLFKWERHKKCTADGPSAEGEASGRRDRR